MHFVCLSVFFCPFANKRVHKITKPLYTILENTIIQYIFYAQDALNDGF